MKDVKQCVYKYVYKDSIIYIGKTNSSLKNRIQAHKNEEKFAKYLEDVKIYYIQLNRKTETSFMEICLINKYNPILNEKEIYGNSFEINVNEPEWTEFIDSDKQGNNCRRKISDKDLFAARIKSLRENSDLTQTQIANELHISQRAYSHYENGDREIPIELLCKLADFYKTSTDYLLNRTD